ncbi:hypothetical protein HUG15_02685 [Salicibibacter cibarius]|uniref:Uncharacterized protein n=1 Tax=Salicibibacter cibarius TaxID=2743000 RepID=A0A7T7CA94_9BACI|nr:hypothetical protein [Salicibibacter cibarius]QQK74613.1 hypothetical protein HUG15_02685 [Salicibibacter cibarius]
MGRLRASKAFANTNPKWLKIFNARYPVIGAPLCNGGKMYTIRGNAEGRIRANWGTLGEVYFGWLTLRFLKRSKSDGLVPYNSAIIDGAEHIGDFSECDHLGLVVHPSVAKKATIALREEETETGT